VRVPDLGDRQALGRSLAQVGFGIGRIDAGGLAASRIVDEIAVVVVEAGELVNFEHGILLAGLIAFNRNAPPVGSREVTKMQNAYFRLFWRLEAISSLPLRDWGDVIVLAHHRHVCVCC
jgi:hypothetical protein